MSGRLFGYARVSVASDADANNLENQRRVLADCEQVFEDVGSGASWKPAGAGACQGDRKAPKLKPRWDVHLSSYDDQLGCAR